MTAVQLIESRTEILSKSRNCQNCNYWQINQNNGNSTCLTCSEPSDVIHFSLIIFLNLLVIYDLFNINCFGSKATEF